MDPGSVRSAISRLTCWQITILVFGKAEIRALVQSTGTVRARMATIPRLVTRGRTFCFRASVPQDLWDVAGQKRLRFRKGLLSEHWLSCDAARSAIMLTSWRRRRGGWLKVRTQQQIGRSVTISAKRWTGGRSSRISSRPKLRWMSRTASPLLRRGSPSFVGVLRSGTSLARQRGAFRLPHLANEGVPAVPVVLYLVPRLSPGFGRLRAPA